MEEAEGAVTVVIVVVDRGNVGVDTGKAFGLRHALSGIARIFKSLGLEKCRGSLQTDRMDRNALSRDCKKGGKGGRNKSLPVLFSRRRGRKMVFQKDNRNRFFFSPILSPSRGPFQSEPPRSRFPFTPDENKGAKALVSRNCRCLSASKANDAESFPRRFGVNRRRRWREDARPRTQEQRRLRLRLLSKELTHAALEQQVRRPIPTDRAHEAVRRKRYFDRPVGEG